MDAVTGAVVFKVVATVAVGLWGLVQQTNLVAKIKEARQRAKESRFRELEEDAEKAVMMTARDMTEAIKLASADGKLTQEEIEGARDMAVANFKTLAKSRGEDAAKALGYAGVDLLVEKAFARLKQAGVLLLVLLCCGVAIGGCGGGGLNDMLPQITTTYPDGRVETRVDPEATKILADAAIGAVDSILDRIDNYQEKKAEAEARGDAAEAARWDRLISLAERKLPQAKAKEVAPSLETPAQSVAEVATP